MLAWFRGVGRFLSNLSGGTLYTTLRETWRVGRLVLRLRRRRLVVRIAGSRWEGVLLLGGALGGGIAIVTAFGLFLAHAFSAWILLALLAIPAALGLLGYAAGVGFESLGIHGRRGERGVLSYGQGGVWREIPLRDLRAFEVAERVVGSGSQVLRPEQTVHRLIARTRLGSAVSVLEADVYIARTELDVLCAALNAYLLGRGTLDEARTRYVAYRRRHVGIAVLLLLAIGAALCALYGLS